MNTDDPEYELLSKIFCSEISYTRSIVNVEKFTSETPKDSIQVAHQILWIAYQPCKILTPMHLLRLVYISHGWMLAIYGRSLFHESVEAWKYGPVSH